jgi:hypothetical protein
VERLTDIVLAKVVKGLTSQVSAPERAGIDYEVFPLVLPMGHDSVVGMAVCLFGPVPGAPYDRMVRREVLADPYARQEAVDRLVMSLVEGLREEYAQIEQGGSP